MLCFVEDAGLLLSLVDLFLKWGTTTCPDLDKSFSDLQTNPTPSKIDCMRYLFQPPPTPPTPTCDITSCPFLHSPHRKTQFERGLRSMLRIDPSAPPSPCPSPSLSSEGGRRAEPGLEVEPDLSLLTPHPDVSSLGEVRGISDLKGGSLTVGLEDRCGGGQRGVSDPTGGTASLEDRCGGGQRGVPDGTASFEDRCGGVQRGVSDGTASFEDRCGGVQSGVPDPTSKMIRSWTPTSEDRRAYVQREIRRRREEEVEDASPPVLSMMDLDEIYERAVSATAFCASCGRPEFFFGRCDGVRGDARRSSLRSAGSERTLMEEEEEEKEEEGKEGEAGTGEGGLGLACRVDFHVDVVMQLRRDRILKGIWGEQRGRERMRPCEGCFGVVFCGDECRDACAGVHGVGRCV
ncbi:hypothetical protein HDU67_005443 [Dinochytrium kinnereticum]|nr:hypothetical protein HDU67_005443 [Dinochytrium kinnereticum]